MKSRRYWFNNTTGFWRFQGHYQAVPIKKDLALGYGKDYLVIGGITGYSLGYAKNYLTIGGLTGYSLGYGKNYLAKGGISAYNLGLGGSYEIRGL